MADKPKPKPAEPDKFDIANVDERNVDYLEKLIDGKGAPMKPAKAV